MTEYIERAAVHELVKRLPKYQMFNYNCGARMDEEDEHEAG